MADDIITTRAPRIHEDRKSALQSIMLALRGSRPYIDASRAPRPEGANTASTATIAPTADVPPRNGIVSRPGLEPTLRSMKYTAVPPISQVPQ